MFLTSRIHRLLGVGFALMVLPVSLGCMAGVILFNAALWAPALGSIVDRSLRYTVDKTTREILFLPLPTDVKLQAKPFVDVTVDRMAKGVGALDPARVDQAVGAEPRVAATELRHAGAGRGVDGHVDSREA